MMHETHLTTAQKRAMFKALFGEILTEKGFVWCKDRYVRIHEGEIQLSVGLYTARRSFASVCFGAVPFCLGETDWQNRWGERIEQFIPFGVERNAYLYSVFEEQLHQSYRLFCDSLFASFNALRDVRSLLDYQQNQLFPTLGYQDHVSAAHICLRLEDWQGAQEHLLTLIAASDEALVGHQKNEEAELQIVGSRKQREQIRASYAGLYECICREKQRLQQDIDLLNCGNYLPLQERIAQNISVSQAASREFFPQVWRQSKV